MSFSQYWNACTKVMERIPPPTTLAITIAADGQRPDPYRHAEKGFQGQMPAPWYCGIR